MKEKASHLAVASNHLRAFMHRLYVHVWGGNICWTPGRMRFMPSLFFIQFDRNRVATVWTDGCRRSYKFSPKVNWIISAFLRSAANHLLVFHGTIIVYHNYSGLWAANIDIDITIYISILWLQTVSKRVPRSTRSWKISAMRPQFTMRLAVDDLGLCHCTTSLLADVTVFH